MRTRSQTRNRNRRQQQQTLPVVVEPCNLEEPIPGQTIVAMADRTMEGYSVHPPRVTEKSYCFTRDNAELTQVDTFYNGLNENEQDSLNAAAGGHTRIQTKLPEEVVERETEEITDEEQNDFQGSTAQIPPPVIPKPIPEPEIPKTLPKSTPLLGT
ncbi:hypothetical protein Tco_0540447 [Tanacetum coccineum]